SPPGAPGGRPLAGGRGALGRCGRDRADFPGRRRRLPMTSVLRAAVRPGAYHDSVMLMRLQAALAGLPGVEDAGVVMATPANRELLAAGGLVPPEGTIAGPNDLLILVRAADEAAAEAALARVDPLLAERASSSAAAGFHPRTVGSAL